MIIQDLYQGVVNKLRGRDDIIPSIPFAAKAAILDLTENYEFEELKITGAITNFVSAPNAIAEYPLNGYDPLGISGNPFIENTDVALTFITSWFVYYDQSGVVTPGVSMGMEMKARSLRVVEPMSKIQGIPSVYCIHGTPRNNGVIIVGNMPNNPYACQMRYQRQHPFPDANLSSQNSNYNNLLAQQVIFMPIDWQDILEYATAEKLCDQLGMTDLGMKYHQKLFGYKDKYGNEIPGLIMARKSQQERMMSYNERRLLPVVRRYT